MRASVQTRAGDLEIDGRLLTIDGLTFKRPTEAGKLTQAIVSATAYIAPDAASPTVPAAATTGGS